MKQIYLATFVLIFSMTVEAKLVKKYTNQTIEYKVGKTNFKNYLVYESHEKKPGIIMLPEWWGLDKNIKEKALKLAKQGYTVLAVDMFGNGKTTTVASEADKLIRDTQSDNFKKGYERFIAALKFLRSHKAVDKKNIGVVGFTYGGALGIEMARRSVDLKAVVNFHGGLWTKNIEKRKRIIAKILVLAGTNDQYIPTRMKELFKKEMKLSGTRYKLVEIEGAFSGFSNPYINEISKQQELHMKYDRKAYKQAWEEMIKFLRMSFK